MVELTFYNHLINTLCDMSPVLVPRPPRLSPESLYTPQSLYNIISHNVCVERFQKVNLPTKSSTYCSILLGETSSSDPSSFRARHACRRSRFTKRNRFTQRSRFTISSHKTYQSHDLESQLPHKMVNSLITVLIKTISRRSCGRVDFTNHLINILCETKSNRTRLTFGARHR